MSVPVELCFRNCGICVNYSPPDQCTCSVPQVCENKCMSEDECRNGNGVCVDKCPLGCICEFSSARPASSAESLKEVTSIIITLLPVLILVQLLKKLT